MRRGSNTIEFALLAPVFFLLITAIVDFGYLFATRYGAGAAAEEGARAGSLVAGTADPEGAARSAALAKWDAIGLASTPTVTVTRAGEPVMLTVRIDLDPVPLIGLAPTTPFHVTAARRMEQP